MLLSGVPVQLIYFAVASYSDTIVGATDMAIYIDGA